MTLDLVFAASAGKSRVGYFLLCTDLLSQRKRAILGAELRYRQQPGEDVDKSLQGAVRDKACQAAYKTREHQKGLKKKVLKTQTSLVKEYCPLASMPNTQKPCR